MSLATGNSDAILSDRAHPVPCEDRMPLSAVRADSSGACGRLQRHVLQGLQLASADSGDLTQAVVENPLEILFSAGLVNPAAFGNRAMRVASREGHVVVLDASPGVPERTG
jgi:hypothetical protein